MIIRPLSSAGLFASQGDWEEEKQNRRWTMGWGKRVRETAARYSVMCGSVAGFMVLW